jgi:hypothetical protein
LWLVITTRSEARRVQRGGISSHWRDIFRS